MRSIVTLIVLGVALASSGCASQEKEWMKVNATYTMAEFRRDYAACTKDGALDETCMRSKGWVALSPGRVDKPVEAPARPGSPSGIGAGTR